MANDSVSVKPYGFIIFRGDYSDDAKWERYMAYLKNQTRRGLESEDLVELYDRMDWKVISSPDLQDIGPEAIREKFQEWLESGEEEFNSNSYRHRACIYVDECCLDCHDGFMEGKSLENDDPIDLIDTEGFTFAILVSRFEEEDWIMVSTSFLMPRAGDIIMMQGEGRGWDEIFEEQGTVSVGF